MSNNGEHSKRKRSRRGTSRQSRRPVPFPAWNTDPTTESDEYYDEDPTEEYDTANYVQKYRQDQSLKKSKNASLTNSEGEHQCPNSVQQHSYMNKSNDVGKRCAF